MDDGDEIVCLKVVEKNADIASDTSVEQKQYRDEAQALMDWVIKKNGEEKAISLNVELAIGKVEKTIQRMVNTNDFLMGLILNVVTDRNI